MNRQLWNRYCQYLAVFEELGLKVDISRMRFETDFLDSIAPKVDAALIAMDELESGAIANPDEERMVGHYWLRTPEKAPNEELAQVITSTLEDITAFARAVHSGEYYAEKGGLFEHVIVVGIGGSALGPQLVADALWTVEDKTQLHFCDNTDPDGYARVCR